MKDDLKELLRVLSETMKYIHMRSYHKANDRHMYPGQHKLLSLIKTNEGITQRDLAEKNMCTPATITGMLNKLEKHRYINRIPDQFDKRILRVYLTPEGRQLANHAETFMASLVEQLFDGFTEEELHTLISLIMKMKNNISKGDKS